MLASSIVDTHKTSKNLCDLPYELKELIAYKCDYFTYERLRSCDSVFHTMPAFKTVDFEEYRVVLRKLRAEKWEFGSDCEEYEKGFWEVDDGSDELEEKYKNDSPKAIAFQSRIHLDLLSLTQDQYLYVCRNALKFEVCRLVKAILLDSVKYSHIDLKAAPVDADEDEEFETCFYSLVYSITTEDVVLLATLLQLQDFDPSDADNFAIRFASENGYLEVVQLLLQNERVDPSADDNYAIRLASYNGHMDIVRLLLQDVRVDPSADNNFAIRWASESGRLEVIQLLVQDERVDPSAYDNCSLKFASENGHLEVVQLLLLDERVDPSAEGGYAMKLASRNGHYGILQILSKDG